MQVSSGIEWTPWSLQRQITMNEHHRRTRGTKGLEDVLLNSLRHEAAICIASLGAPPMSAIEGDGDDRRTVA
jgi:hypothetical protein